MPGCFRCGKEQKVLTSITPKGAKLELITIIIIILLMQWNIYLNTKQLEDYQAEMIRLNNQITDLEKQIESFLDKWNVAVFEITAYAPLDPRAKEGMCFSGDPRVTASGAKTTPGVTIAAGQNIPFGTKMYIKDYGWREVHDRGPAIGEGNIDLCVWTQEEAWDIGRRKAVVVWEKR